MLAENSNSKRSSSQGAEHSKRLLADAMLDNVVLKDLLGKP